jgi:hypothetical protein
MPVAPETEGREALINALKKIYEAEKFGVRSDKLHGSLGFQGTVLGVSPVRFAPWSKDYNVNQYEFLVQFYHAYTKEVNPNQVVDPAVIEGYANRFREGIKEGTDPKTGHLWYFTLLRINYPDDPTGNKSRYEAFVTGWGNNF